jgi:molybdopterin-containing oxidoreductase family iron-sulfur binding subunit
MKRTFDHSAPEQTTDGALTGPRYWRSLDELAETPGFKEQIAREFPEGADNLNGVDRRRFFKLMAASFALGGVGLATGCRRPEQHILAYGKSVEHIIPGLPLYYASAFPIRRNAIPVLAETHQGRPTKIEGNPSFASYGGATNAIVQASVLDLYDPDRATTHTVRGAAASPAQIQDLLAAIGAEARAARGAGLVFLAESSGSPTRERLVARLQRELPEALWAEYDAVRDEPPAAAARAAFGRDGLKPLYRFAKAKRVVSLDADFFGAEAGAIGYTRDFAKARRAHTKDAEINRLYAVESTFTLTGSMADHRLRLASSHLLAFAAALHGAVTGSADFASLASGLQFKDQEKWLAECAKDLRDHRGQALVVAGSHLPAEVHALVYALNAALGAIGQTVDFVAAPAPASAGIAEVAAALNSGSVKTLVVLGGNPAYNAPADLQFTAALARAGQVVRLGYHVDETSHAARSGAHIAAAHYLESWGDARTADGTIVPVQPMILPLFGGLSDIEVLARILGEGKADGYSLVYQTITAHNALGGTEGDKGFRQFLHDGFLAGSAYQVANPGLNAAGLRELLGAASSRALPVVGPDALEVRFFTDAKMDDGRFANNGWLQECPEPITKISWDNAILVSPRLGKELGIEPGGSLFQVARKETAAFTQGKERAFVGELTVNGRTLRGPIHIQPGLSNYTVAVALGYGRGITGRVGTGVGFDAYQIRTSDNLGFANGAKLSVVSGASYLLANTQEHWSMEGRDIVREANVDEFRTNPGFVAGMGMEAHSPAIYGDLTPEQFAKKSPAERAKITAERAATTPRGGSLMETPDFSGPQAFLDGVHQWGMSIDLNTCIGCNACVIACQAENNIPIVGKDQVLRGREMHWIRLDRYYSDGKLEAGAFGGPGNAELPEDPQVSLQPMTCQHCELAPCETVCPVNATVHDQEGLNTMAYNRCIGTRYCANNCPYKVRRFNFFDYNQRQLDKLYLGPLAPKGMPELVKMVKNPDVTVRMRGVMEKCTYCVQRIQQAKIAQKVKAGASADVTVPDGAFTVACAQACPAEAIVFGNVKDPQSRVSQLKALEQDYQVLGYLNIRPRTTYLGKLRNPNRAMPDYYELPLSRLEYKNKNYPAGMQGKDHGASPKHIGPGHGTPSRDSQTPNEDHKPHASLGKILFGGNS